MAFQTLRRQVRPGQRKIRRVVVKSTVRVASRVTGETSRIFISITAQSIVRIVRFRIDVANRARKFRKIGWIDVAICTLRPLPQMLAAVNGKILGIVLRVFCGHPIQIGRVAGGAVVGEIGLNVVRVGGSLKILLVASDAIGRRIGKIATYMAFRAVRYFMPFCQGEKVVIHLVGSPTRRKHIMALQAIG